MRTFVAVMKAPRASDFTELVLGFDVELFAGVLGESTPDRRVRLTVAREVLAELPAEDARSAKALMNGSNRRSTSGRRAA